MEKIYFNIWPNIDFFIAVYTAYFRIINLMLGISIFFIIFLIIKIINTRNLIKKKENEYQNMIIQIRSYYKKRLFHLEGKQFIKDFINYIETLNIDHEYKNIDYLLISIGLEKDDIEKVKQIIYKDIPEFEVIERIKEKIS